jgi:hypothetical protein
VITSDEAFQAPFQVRLEWGWGPWGDLALDRVCDWTFEVAVGGGRVLRAFPCLQSGPFDELRRHRIEHQGDDRLSVQSYSARQGGYRQNPNQSLVLEIEGEPATSIEVRMSAPVAQTTRTGLAGLLEGARHVFTGPFPKESWQWHRLVPRAASALADHQRLRVPDGRSYVYLRVRQQNGQMAWVSPVFLNYA